METIQPHHRQPTTERTELSVAGMTCSGCARHVTDALQAVPGVASAQVSLERKRASVRWAKGSATDAAALLKAVCEAGFEVKALEPDAVAAASESGGSPSLWGMSVLTGLAPTALLMAGEWIFRLGGQEWFRWASFALAAVVQFGPGRRFYRGAWNQLKAGASNMDTLVALGSTTAFAYSAWALCSGAGGHLYFMEAVAIITLISVGHWIEARVSARASSALRSLMQLTPQTARRLQPQRRTGDPRPAAIPPAGEGAQGTAPTTKFSARDILNFKPDAPVQTTEVEVPVSALTIGDRVVLRPGDRVPVDGTVVEGASAVDEAMLTGESVPVDKSTKAELYAGTVNLNGRLVMRVTATGETTALAHIIAAVQRAQTSRAGIQRLGDRVSNVFVPVVVAVAIAAGLWWGFAPASARHVHAWLAQFLWFAHPPAGAAAGFIIAAAVLIIACPCAMGLATPAAIMAAANAAARRGILIRDGVALEKAGEVTAVIFDKTGTLTMGQPQVVKVVALSEEAQRAGSETGAPIASIAAALARHSTHPISQAVAKLSAEDIKLNNWQEVRGAGVQADLQPPTANTQPPRGRARLGSLPWLRESNMDLAAGAGFIAEWSAQGATLVGLAIDNSLVALFAVRDTLKPDAADVVALLQQQGLKVYLLTGDNALTAARIAKQVGIAPENVFAEVRPNQKAEFVKKLQAQGERVAFVGDGQ